MHGTKILRNVCITLDVTDSIVREILVQMRRCVLINSANPGVAATN